MSRYPVTNALCLVYEEWNAYQGLSLGSAEEHLDDPHLTEEQRDWLAAFVDLWDLTQREEESHEHGGDTENAPSVPAPTRTAVSR
jgi:hypothetical protein